MWRTTFDSEKLLNNNTNFERVSAFEVRKTNMHKN